MLGANLAIGSLAMRRRAAAAGTTLDFTQNLYQFGGTSASDPAAVPGWSFSRSGAGTALTDAGGVTGFAANAPRITNRGFLIEASRTNLLQSSQQIDGAYWEKGDVTVTANTAAAPDGTMTADRLTDNGAAGRHILYRTMSGTTATSQTFQVFLKQGSLRYAQVQLSGSARFGVLVDLQTGTAVSTSNTGSPSGTTYSVTPSINGFWRVSVGWTGPGGTIYPIIALSNAASPTFEGNQNPSYAGSGGFIEVWQADLVEAVGGTSPIVTTTASLTRGADAVSLTVPAGVSTYAATYNGGASVTGSATPGATFDLATGRPWLNGYLQTLTFV